jgi:hypothetical protein
MVLAVTELGILYQKPPEHGVRPANTGGRILDRQPAASSKDADSIDNE